MGLTLKKEKSCPEKEKRKPQEKKKVLLHWKGGGEFDKSPNRNEQRTWGKNCSPKKKNQQKGNF